MIDITDPTTPSLISTYNTPDLAYNVVVAGDRAFVADRNTGLIILDITNPASPVLVDTYDTTGSARSVAVDGAHAFVAGDASGLQVIQVAASMDPALTSTLALSGGPGDVRAWGIDVVGNYAFVADDAGGGLQIIDISDSAAPFVAGNYDSPGLARGIAVSGNFAFLADGPSGLTIVDISDPTTPTFLGSRDTPGFARRVAVTGDFAYVADEIGGGLQVVDVSDPTAPTLVGSLTTIAAYDVALAGEHAYIADVTVGLRVVDISDATNPILIATTPSGGSQGLGAAGDYVFMAGASLVIIDASNPMNPVPVDTVAVSGGDAAVAGDRVVVGTGTGVLEIIDISDPANAVLLLPISTTLAVPGVATNGQFVFGATDASGLTIGQIFQDEVNATNGAGRSLELDDGSDTIFRARISSSETGGVSWELSPNGGADFEVFSPGVWTPFTNLGADLRWRSVHTWEPGLNPTVSSLTVDWLFEFAPITPITDVPDDQGGRAYVGLIRSGFDFADEPSTPVTQYGVYRRVDNPALQEQIRWQVGSDLESLAKAGDDAVSLPGVASTWIDGTQYVVGAGAGAFPPGTWALIVTVPATQSDGYLAEVTTAADSSATGTNHSVFVVTTHTTTPSVWFASAPDSGYSVDNIAPGAPVAMTAAYQAGGVTLDWEDAPETDFQFYRVYRDTDPGFTPSAGEIVQETAVSGWTDPTSDPWAYHYKITTLDHSGNESEASTPSEVTGVQSGTVPTRTALLGAVPNPFNPSTKLSFEMAAAGHARLKVYDTAGRLVVTLVDEHHDAGSHYVIWEGRDSAGRMSSAGVYLYRLEAGGHVETKRMTLVK